MNLQDSELLLCLEVMRKFILRSVLYGISLIHESGVREGAK